MSDNLPTSDFMEAAEFARPPSISTRMRQTADCNMEPYKLSEDQLRDFLEEMAYEVEEMERVLGWDNLERKHGIPVEILENTNPDVIVRFKESMVKGVLVTPGLSIFIPKGKVGFGWIRPGFPETSIANLNIALLNGFMICEVVVSETLVEVIENLVEQP